MTLLKEDEDITWQTSFCPAAYLQGEAAVSGYQRPHSWMPTHLMDVTNGHRESNLDETNATVEPKYLIPWWAQKDSNLQPKDYESSALTVEL